MRLWNQRRADGHLGIFIVAGKTASRVCPPPSSENISSVWRHWEPAPGQSPRLRGGSEPMGHCEKLRILRGTSLCMESAVYGLLPETGSVDVQRGTPGPHHAKHTHPTPEILLIVSGTIPYHLDKDDDRCTCRDSLSLPANTQLASTTGNKGYLGIMATLSPIILQRGGV